MTEHKLCPKCGASVHVCEHLYALPDRTFAAQTPREFVAFTRELIDTSQKDVKRGARSEQEHARIVRACLSDTLRYLDRFGDSMPEKDDDGSDW